MTKPFQYKVPRTRRAPVKVDRLDTGAEVETFTRELQGMKASDIEERSARSLDRRNISYDFRSAFIAPRNVQGEVELDFMVYIGNVMQPVQIDGEFAHLTQQQKQEDRVKDAILNERLRRDGAYPVIRIPQRYLETQEQSNRTWDRVLAGDIGDFIDNA